MISDNNMVNALNEALAEPSTNDEQTLQFALVGLRTMTPDMQRAFIVAALDEYCGLAKEGHVDPYVAGQILTRAQLIASFLIARETPKLTVVSNHHG